VSLLSAKPAAEVVRKLEGLAAPKEKLAAEGREL
jgi:hypothetical protein